MCTDDFFSQMSTIVYKLFLTMALVGYRFYSFPDVKQEKVERLFDSGGGIGWRSDLEVFSDTV